MSDPQSFNWHFEDKSRIWNNLLRELTLKHFKDNDDFRLLYEAKGMIKAREALTPHILATVSEAEARLKINIVRFFGKCENDFNAIYSNAQYQQRRIDLAQSCLPNDVYLLRELGKECASNKDLLSELIARVQRCRITLQARDDSLGSSSDEELAQVFRSFGELLTCYAPDYTIQNSVLKDAVTIKDFHISKLQFKKFMTSFQIYGVIFIEIGFYDYVLKIMLIVAKFWIDYWNNIRTAIVDRMLDLPKSGGSEAPLSRISVTPPTIGKTDEKVSSDIKDSIPPQKIDRELLQAAFILKAFDPYTLKTKTQVVKKYNPYKNPNDGNVSAAFTRLKKQNLIETSQGQEGGLWLTELGQSVVKAQNAGRER